MINCKFYLFRLRRAIIISSKMVKLTQLTALLFYIFSIYGVELEHCSADLKDGCSITNFHHLLANNSKLVEEDILVYTVATEKTDGFNRYIQSAKEYEIEPIVLGMDQEWKGGDDMKKRPGGAWKINLLKKALSSMNDKENQKKIILFTDGYDVIFLNNLKEINKAFVKTGAGILFGAETFCWPDASLSSKYPNVTHGKRFLNSGLFMGFLPEIKKLLDYKIVEDTDDDQLYYTQAYLDQEFRSKLNIKLDHTSEIFQNLNGALAEVELSPQFDKESKDVFLRNIYSHTQPLVLHGNGPSKRYLNAMSNYLAKAWNYEDGCRHCKVGQINLEGAETHKYPSVLIAIFVEQATPFLEEMLQKIHGLDYPKEKLHLFIHNNVQHHASLVNSFMDHISTEYVSVKQILPEDEISEARARDLSLDVCVQKQCEIYFSVDSIAHLDNPHSLRLLIEQNRTVVAPLLARPGKSWSNFWGALTTEGYYARSHDYMEIVYNEKRGLWNVPFISSCYLVNATLLRKYDRSKLSFTKDNLDADMAFCTNLRDLDVFMYVSNRLDFGHLINPETFDVTRTKPDMYQIFENQMDWEDRYIHEDYAENLNPDKKAEQPCPDVYWFPIVTRRFANDLIHMMEAFGKWSDGTNEDTRLESGYEAVPTRDIHMNQVGWERHWLYFLQKYVRPLQEHVFTGYVHDPPKSLMNFVVRYRPDEQPSLRPHHDSSTYTINIALNERGVDYEGGGCRFIRYNCSVIDTRPGWMMMHPGRLTHYHEGLLVTKGTRYIMIAFVDP